MGLRDVESTLPPGFRFYPSDEELVCHYLYRKVKNVAVGRSSEETMVEVDLHTSEPWELPDAAKLSAKEWYFFSFRDRKYATGSRTNRATRSGYWKATGKDRIICNPITQAMVGMRKTLVFYRGRAPNGIKSSWVMHEFRLETLRSPPKEDWVLCRVFHKMKKGDSASADGLDNARSSSPTPGFSVLSPSLADLPMAVESLAVGGRHEQRPTISSPFLLRQQQQDQDLSSCSSSSNPAALEALLQRNYYSQSLQEEMDMMMLMRCEGGGAPGGGDQVGLLMDLGFQNCGGVGYCSNNDLPGWQ